jgi:uncharacterized protein (TIGR03435 family)
MKTIRSRVALVALALMAAAFVAAQEQPAVLEASFEAATFKRNVSGGNNLTLNPQPTGRFSVVNFPLATLITAAYQLQPHQLIDAPDWTRNERYDITAKFDPTLAGRLQPDGHPPTWALALRSLLRDRAGLEFTREKRQRPIYALVKARDDGRLGPNLRPAEFDCDALREQAVAAARAGRPSPYPPATPTRIACGVRNVPGRIVYGGSALPEFLGALSILVGRPVIDRTGLSGPGLSGRWDFVLTYTPENRLAGGDAVDPNAPDLFTALREQLGLKLESTEGPVDVLVVTRVERPAE